MPSTVKPRVALVGRAAAVLWLPRAALGLALLFYAARVGAVCVGDCSGDGHVTVDEILTMVNIALSSGSVSPCPAGDPDHSQTITVDEILAAVTSTLNGCPAEAPTPTPSPTGSMEQTPQPTPTPPAGCGNGRVDFNLGETCDDGNTLDGDSCPYNCRIATCTGAGTTLTVDVSFTPPDGVDVISLLIFLRYPDGVVKIPGMNSDPQVQDRILNTPDGAFTTPNDLDYAVRLAIFAADVPPAPFAPGLLFSVEFDNCRDATPPSVSDFRCTVEGAAGIDTLPVAGVTCAVSIP